MIVVFYLDGYFKKSNVILSMRFCCFHCQPNNSTYCVQISYWLGSLLDREKIPDYEVNEFTIGTLSTIMNSNMELDSIVKILIDEVNRQNEEYEAKGNF